MDYSYRRDKNVIPPSHKLWSQERQKCDPHVTDFGHRRDPNVFPHVTDFGHMRDKNVFPMSWTLVTGEKKM